jgi:hypothetical protein
MKSKNRLVTLIIIQMMGSKTECFSQFKLIFKEPTNGSTFQLGGNPQGFQSPVPPASRPILFSFTMELCDHPNSPNTPPLASVPALNIIVDGAIVAGPFHPPQEPSESRERKIICEIGIGRHELSSEGCAGESSTSISFDVTPLAPPPAARAVPVTAAGPPWTRHPVTRSLLAMLCEGVSEAGIETESAAGDGPGIDSSRSGIEAGSGDGGDDAQGCFEVARALLAHADGDALDTLFFLPCSGGGSSTSVPAVGACGAASGGSVAVCPPSLASPPVFLAAAGDGGGASACVTHRPRASPPALWRAHIPPGAAGAGRYEYVLLADAAQLRRAGLGTGAGRPGGGPGFRLGRFLEVVREAGAHLAEPAADDGGAVAGWMARLRPPSPLRTTCSPCSGGF